MAVSGTSGCLSWQYPVFFAFLVCPKVHRVDFAPFQPLLTALLEYFDVFNGIVQRGVQLFELCIA